MYGDLSAGSGLNALLRDEDHAREFLKRHQNKLMYGSDCNDSEGEGTGARARSSSQPCGVSPPIRNRRRKFCTATRSQLLKIR